MADAAHPQPLVLPVDADMLQRLHGQSCMVCGGKDGSLQPAGFVYTYSADGCLGWPVVAHHSHQVKVDAA